MNEKDLKQICAEIRKTPLNFYRQYLVSKDGELLTIGGVLNNGYTNFEKNDGDFVLQFYGDRFCSHAKINDQFYDRLS